MLTLTTGNPGAGKTLHTVTTVEARRLKEKREVYQDGVPDLVYPWMQLPTTIRKERIRGKEVDRIVPLWGEIPDGCIVVIDECWRVFPVRGAGSDVPDFVQFLATHRHRGIDIYLTTQQVKTQIDTFVRGLIGQHFHLERKAGLEYSMRYEWERCADPSSTKDVAEARNGRWVFPKDAYGSYRSATEHTHKRNLPVKRLVLFGLGVSLAAILLGYGFHSVYVNHGLAAGQKPIAAAEGKATGKVDRGSAGDFWIRDRVPRLPGNPASAPVFDPLQKVASQPRPEGCMEIQRGSSVKCECTGPNHSVLQMSLMQCEDLVHRGWFDETRKYDDVKASNIARLDAQSGKMAEGTVGDSDQGKQSKD